MRVLQLVKTGTGANWAFTQMRELIHLGVDVHVALPPNSPRQEQYRSAGVVVHSIQTDFPIRQPHRIPALVADFRRLVAEVEPDIIHSHFVGTTLTMRLALGKHHAIPRIFQVPGPLHLEHPVFRRAEFASAGAHDYWFGTCEWTCDKYRSMGVDEGRIFLRHYGKDLESFTRNRRTGRLREMLEIRESTSIVGMVAYMYPPKRYLGQRRGLKGHEDFIDALRICVDRGADVVGVIIGGYSKPGEHPYEEQVRAYAAEKLGTKVVLLGKRNDVPDLYPDFDVAVHPSHSENLGGATESLLLEVPTIATRVGGFPEVVKPGETGLLVPPKSPRDLADAIMEMLAQPARYRDMAKSGRALTEGLLHLQRNTSKVYDSYCQILGR